MEIIATGRIKGCREILHNPGFSDADSAFYVKHLPVSLLMPFDHILDNISVHVIYTFP